MAVKQVVGMGQTKVICASTDAKPSATYANGGPGLTGDGLYEYDTNKDYITIDNGTTWVFVGANDITWD